MTTPTDKSDVELDVRDLNHIALEARYKRLKEQFAVAAKKGSFIYPEYNLGALESQKQLEELAAIIHPVHVKRLREEKFIVDGPFNTRRGKGYYVSWDTSAVVIDYSNHPDVNKKCNNYI